jgi:hypothetical protein
LNKGDSANVIANKHDADSINPPKDKKSSNLKFYLGDKFDGNEFSSGTNFTGTYFPGTNFPLGQIFCDKFSCNQKIYLECRIEILDPNLHQDARFSGSHAKKHGTALQELN